MIAELVRRTNFGAIPINYQDHISNVENRASALLSQNFTDLHTDEVWLDSETFDVATTAFTLGVQNQINIVGTYYNLVHTIHEKMHEAFRTFDKTFWILALTSFVLLPLVVAFYQFFFEIINSNFTLKQSEIPKTSLRRSFRERKLMGEAFETPKVTFLENTFFDKKLIEKQINADVLKLLSLFNTHSLSFFQIFFTSFSK